MHSLVTVSVPFDGARSADVEAALDRFGNPPDQAVANALDSAGFVHFMSICVIPAKKAPADAHLVIELSADGGRELVLRRLVETVDLQQLLDIAGHRVDAPALASFLLRHTLSPGQGWFSVTGLDYDGTPGMTVWRIRREAALANKVAELLEREPRSDSALDALQKMRAKLWEDGDWKWAFVAEPAALLSGTSASSDRPKGDDRSTSFGRLSRLGRALPALAVSATANFLWPLALATVLAFGAGWWLWRATAGLWLAFVVIAVGTALVVAAYFALRRREDRDLPDDVEPAPDRIAEIMQRENFGAQNHLAAVSILKPGFLRRLTLRIGLWAARQIAIHFSRPSFLGTTGVIHFARWVVLPGTDKLLFFSNYDGAWESYLEDFIEKASQGVTGIWSNTQGFPRSTNLFNAGAADGNRLRRWTRRQQFPSRFWYSAYPSLTLDRIRLNAAVRQGIACARTEAEALDWLSCFGSSPRPPTRIETDEVQTLAFGGLRPLLYSRCLFVSLSEDARLISTWLDQIREEVTFGEGRAAKSATLIGLKQTALRKLGLDAALATFPVAYQHGSQAPWRRRALGDTDDNAPENWLWGGPGTDIDAVVLLYDTEERALDERTSAYRAVMEKLGHRVALQVDLEPLPDRQKAVREPFGFVEGISNPVIRGSANWARKQEPLQVVEAGEIILGYPDNSGTLPNSPSVAAAEDPTGILPTVTREPFRHRPDFASPQGTGRHDLGRNGSYLVIRQLEQDVDAFRETCRRIAKALSEQQLAPPLNGTPVEEWVAAKMVGRWRDGSSLVRYPHAPRQHADRPDNSFLFGVEDPDGMRCPFGAHIRRANPRDTFAPGSDVQLRITNRHRILRVGRAYKAQNNRKNPGLLFMCLNTDIERQFEFVQQTWVLGRSFNGLENEADPVLRYGSLPKVFTIPTETGPLRLRGMADCVRLLGSGYFFLPSRSALRYLANQGAIQPHAAATGGDDLGAYAVSTLPSHSSG